MPVETITTTKQHKIIARIVRAYRNKIRRQIQPGSEFSFWQVIAADVEILIRHIERHMEKGMTWENYGEWHLVNRRPLSARGIRTAKEFYSYFYYANYRPRWVTPRVLPVLKNGKQARPYARA